MHVTGLKWWKVNIGSGNGLVPSGNKPLPEPVLTQIYVTTWRCGSNCVTHCGLEISQNFIIFVSSNVLVLNTDLLSTVPWRIKFSSHWNKRSDFYSTKCIWKCCQQIFSHFVNSLGPSDAIWWHRSGQLGSGNGLLPDGTKPLPAPMLTYHKYGPMAIAQGVFHIKYISHQLLK